MKKIPIELLTAANNPANSPLVWDGSNIVVSARSDMNLTRIVNDLRTSIVRLTEHERLIRRVKESADRSSPLVEAMYAELYPELKQQVAINEEGLRRLDSRVEETETLLESLSENVPTTNIETRVSLLEVKVQSLQTAPVARSVGLPNGDALRSFLTTTETLRSDLKADYPSWTIKSKSSALSVNADGLDSFILDLDTSEILNRLNISKGLVNDDEIAGPSVMIDPRLVQGDGKTTHVSYDRMSGSFTIRLLPPESVPSPKVQVDNRYLKYHNTDLTLDKEFTHANVSVFTYESANYYGQTTVDESRFTIIEDSSIYHFLPRELSHDDRIAGSNLNYHLKHGVFNIANVPTLKGSFFLLNDFNAVPSVAVHALPAAKIHESAPGKTCRIEIEFSLLMEWLNNPLVLYGKEFPITDRNFIFPFCLYWIHNASTNSSALVSGEMLRFSSLTGDGYGSMACYRTTLIYPASILSDMFLDQGIIQVYFITGFKVADVSTELFVDTLYGNYLIEPKFSAIVTYQ